jgi:hypothetical protein
MPGRYALLLTTAVFCCALSLTSCGMWKSYQLQGQWQGVRLMEGKDSVAVDPSLIQLTIDKDAYAFSSTLNYREEGSWRLEDEVLYTTNKLVDNSYEKAVYILQLKRDTLVLWMMDDGKERVLTLRRRR